MHVDMHPTPTSPARVGFGRCGVARPSRARLHTPWLAVATAMTLLLAGCSGGGGGGDSPMPQRLEPLAGPPEAGGQGHRDGLQQSARLGLPSAVAAAPDGGLWLLDGNSTLLRRVDEQGQVRTIRSLQSLPGFTDGNGDRVVLASPQALAVAPDGTVYLAVQRQRLSRTGATPTSAPEVVVDNRWAVLRVPQAGDTTVVATDPQAGTGPQNSQVTAMAVDRNGRLHVADGWACTVWRVQADGTLAAAYEGPAAATPQRCNGIGARGQVVSRLAFDPDGQMVLGLANGEIWRHAPGAAPVRLAAGAGSGLACNGLAWLPGGQMVVAGVGGGTALHRVEPDGAPRRWVGDETDSRWVDGDAASARFGAACSLAVDRAGRLIVADTQSHALRRVDAQGQVGTWVGLPSQNGWQDGPGRVARFDAAFGLAAAADGGAELWVADGGNQALRRVSLSGVVRTVSGAPVRGTQPVAVDGGAQQLRWAGPYAVAPRADGSAWVADGARLRLFQADGSARSLPGDAIGMHPVLATMPDGAVVVLAADDPLGTWPASQPTPTRLQMELRGVDGSRRDLLAHRPSLVEEASRLGARPRGLCRAPDGTLYFTLGHAVLSLRSDGQVQRHAGELAERGAADGPSAQARFNHPWGLACDAQGQVYVADTGNLAVRRIGTQGTVDTVLGRLGVQGVVFGAAPGGLEGPRQVVLTADGLVVADALGLVRARW